MTLTEFVTARLDELEATAKACLGIITDAALPHPSRTLREIGAVRAILAGLPAYSKQRRELRDHVYLPEHSEYHSGHADGTDDSARYMLRHFAAVWSDHPDYREEWKP